MTTTGRANITTPDNSTSFSSCPGMSDTIYIQSKSSINNNQTVLKKLCKSLRNLKNNDIILGMCHICITELSFNKCSWCPQTHPQASRQCSTLHFNSDDRKDVIDILSQQELTLQQLQHKMVHFTNVIVKSNSMCRRNRIHVSFFTAGCDPLGENFYENMKWVGNFCSADAD